MCTKTTCLKNDKNTPYFPNLDGLRFIAFAVVFFYHAFIYFKPPHLEGFEKTFDFLFILFTFNDHAGQIGVDFFFVLSGFLITYLILNEIEIRKKFSLFKFYGRRILRIWPMYYFSLFIGFIIFPYLLSLVGLVPVNSDMNVWNFVLFLANFDIFLHGYPSPVLGVHWSVAIEEQFYLLWPLLFVIFPKKIWKYVFPVFLLIPFLYTWFSKDYDRQFHTLTAFNYLAMGGLLGYLYQYHLEKLNLFLQKIPKYGIVFIYAFFFLFVYFHKALLFDLNIPYQYYKPFVNILFAVFFAFVILEQNRSNYSFFKMSNYTFLTWCGKYTYSLYLMHMFVIMMVKVACMKFGLIIDIHSFWMYILLALGLSLALSFITYHIIEKPFLILKKKLVDK